MTEIRLDDEITARAGTPAELLTRVASRQPYPEGDARVSTAAWEFLFASRRRGLQSRRRRETAEAAELLELGWLDGFGSPTGPGREIVDLRARATMSFRASARGAGATTGWFAWIDGDRAVVAAEPQNLDRTSPATDERRVVHLTSSESALGLLVSWAGIAPAWTWGHDRGDGQIARRDLDARIDAPEGEVPALDPSASWVTARAWSAGQWMALEAGSGVTHIATSAVRAGDAGWFRPRPVDRRTVRLEPTMSSVVMRELIGVWTQSLATAPRR